MECGELLLEVGCQLGHMRLQLVPVALLHGLVRFCLVAQLLVKVRLQKAHLVGLALLLVLIRVPLTLHFELRQQALHMSSASSGMQGIAHGCQYAQYKYGCTGIIVFPFCFGSLLGKREEVHKGMTFLVDVLDALGLLLQVCHRGGADARVSFPCLCLVGIEHLHDVIIYQPTAPISPYLLIDRILQEILPTIDGTKEVFIVFGVTPEIQECLIVIANLVAMIYNLTPNRS